jgi:hypothetical protein
LLQPPPQRGLELGPEEAKVADASGADIAGRDALQLARRILVAVAMRFNCGALSRQ